MKIALTIWGNRISPVFDSAQTLLVVEIENDRVVKKSHENFNSNCAGLIENFKIQDVSVLICGAISEKPANLLALSKIKLIPFVTGNAAQVLDLYLNKKAFPAAYSMPGYTRQACPNGLKNAVSNFNNQE